MKIAFYDVTTTVSIGGIQTTVWELANRCAERGNDVHVYGGNGDIRPKVLHPGIQVYTFPFIKREKFPSVGTRFQRIMERLTMTFYAKKTLQNHEYDLIFFTKPFDFFVPFFLSPNTKTKYALASGGTDFFLFDRYLAKRIDYWFTCSHFNAWQLTSHYKKKVKVIYNGVNTDIFCPQKKDAALIKKLSIKEEETVFIFAGRVVGWKGVQFIVDAMARSIISSHPVRLLVVGDGSGKNSIVNKVSLLGLTDKVSFLDFVPHHDLPRYYSVAHCAIYPSIGDEAFGISIAEAMSCGKPVIASYCGGIPEVVGTEGRCGFLVGLADADEIAEKMLYFISNPIIRREMGDMARKRIIGQFTWNHSADRLLDSLPQ